MYLKFVSFYMIFEIYGKMFMLYKRKFLFNYLNFYKYFLLKLQWMASELSTRFLTDHLEMNKHLNRATCATCNFSQSSTSKVIAHVNKCPPAKFATLDWQTQCICDLGELLRTYTFWKVVFYTDSVCVILIFVHSIVIPSHT